MLPRSFAMLRMTIIVILRKSPQFFRTFAPIMRILTDTQYIHQLVAEGEHDHQDFKFEISDARKIARSISAFANTGGGRLLVGVKDNGKIAGIRSEEEIHVQINDINFLAYIDRIDTSQNTTNIIDYKTTTSKTKTEVNIIDLITSPESAYHELFQILLYCYIYKLHFGATPTMPTLYKMYSIKSQNGKLSTITLHIPNQLLSPPLPPFDIDLNEINTKNSTKIQITDYQQISAPFEWLVHKLLHDIYDPNKPFTTNIHDTKLKACSYCYYSTICHIKNTK